MTDIKPGMWRIAKPSSIVMSFRSFWRVVPASYSG